MEKDVIWYEVRHNFKDGSSSTRTFSNYPEAQDAFDNINENEGETYLVQCKNTVIKYKKSN